MQIEPNGKFPKHYSIAFDELRSSGKLFSKLIIKQHKRRRCFDKHAAYQDFRQFSELLSSYSLFAFGHDTEKLYNPMLYLNKT